MSMTHLCFMTVVDVCSVLLKIIFTVDLAYLIDSRGHVLKLYFTKNRQCRI
jgi:hypothetical protein